MSADQKEYSQLRFAVVDAFLPMLVAIGSIIGGRVLQLHNEGTPLTVADVLAPVYIPLAAGSVIALWRLWVYTPVAQRRLDRKHSPRPRKS